jgi:hypothetical protein
VAPSTAGSSCASSVRRRSAIKPHEKPAHLEEESHLARHCASVVLEDQKYAE